MIQNFLIKKIRNLKKNKVRNNYLLLTLVLIIFFIFNNTFTNTYIILKNNYEKRLVKYYGFCEKQGYGFLKKYNKKYDLKNRSKIINHDNRYPSSGWMIQQFEQPQKFKYIVHLNSQFSNFHEKILENEYNCFILKND